MGGDGPALAAKGATRTIPIVFASTSDPVTGLVASLNRPDGNLTGVTFLLSVIAEKQFEVLQEAVPKPGTIGFLTNPTLPEGESAATEVRAAAQALGHELFVADASNEREIDAAFALLAQRRIGALFVGNDVFFYSRREQIVALAARHAIPAIYVVREYKGGSFSVKVVCEKIFWCGRAISLAALASA